MVITYENETYHLGDIRRCELVYCVFHVMLTPHGWRHLDTHGIEPTHLAIPKRIPHKHKLKIDRISAKKKTIFFVCSECGFERGYNRWRIHTILTCNTKHKKKRLGKKDRSN